MVAWVRTLFWLNRGGAMRRYALIFLGAVFVSPALADKKIDPDPAFLAKARSAATAAVEPHYDLVSEKVPFWARFLICAGQLTAARDEGRALPIRKDEIEKLIADYRARAADVIAYRQKVDAKAPATDVDGEIAKIRSGAMQFLPADTTKLGAETMKKRHGERLAFCQLTRDWYDMQSGQRQAASAADQKKLSAVHDEAMRVFGDFFVGRWRLQRSHGQYCGRRPLARRASTNDAAAPAREPADP